MSHISCKGRFCSFNPSHPHSRITAPIEPSQNPSFKQSSPRSGRHRPLSAEPPPHHPAQPKRGPPGRDSPPEPASGARPGCRNRSSCLQGEGQGGLRAPRTPRPLLTEAPARRHAPKPRKHMSARTSRRCGRRLGSHTADRARGEAAEPSSPPSGPSRARSSSAIAPPSPGRRHVTARQVTGAAHNAPRLPWQRAGPARPAGP